VTVRDGSDRRLLDAVELDGARFDFESGSPGYVGTLYFIYGDTISGDPLVLVRENGALATVS